MSMIDDIKKNVETPEKKEEEVVRVDYTEQFNAEMAPLITQLFEVSERTGIPIFIAAQTKTDETGSHYNATGSADKSKGASKQFFRMVNDAKYMLKNNVYSRGEALPAIGRTMIPLITSLDVLEKTDDPVTKEEAFNVIKRSLILFTAVMERM